MPVKNNIELGNGRLYISGLEESFEVHDCEATYEPEFVDDQEPYIKLSQEPIEFTIDNVETPRGWVMVKCKECGYEFPVTEFYLLLFGDKGWICPACRLNALTKALQKI